MSSRRYELIISERQAATIAVGLKVLAHVVQTSGAMLLDAGTPLNPSHLEGLRDLEEAFKKLDPDFINPLIELEE